MASLNKQIILIGLFAIFIVSCTSYNEEIKIDVQDYNNLTPNSLYTKLKIVNIVVDQTEFDRMYSNFNEEIEIEAFLNIYKDNVNIISDERIELQIKGGISVNNDLKSLGIKFYNQFNNENRDLINPNHHSFHSLDKFIALRLRNSGNDFFDTMIKDISYTELALQANLDLDLMYSEQTVVFINSTFLGLMNLRTESNTNGMAGLYNVDKKDITSAKITGYGVLEKKDGDFHRIDNFIEAIKDRNFDYLNNEIDVNNFIDYIIFQSYIANTDWPHNNVRFYAITDKPFRFVLFDLDFVADRNIKDSQNDFINGSHKNPISDLFHIMYNNENFKQKFDTRLQYLKNSDLLSSEKFNIIVNEYKNNIEAIMPTHISKYGTPETLIEWYINIRNLKNNFKFRESYLK